VLVHPTTISTTNNPATLANLRTNRLPYALDLIERWNDVTINGGGVMTLVGDNTLNSIRFNNIGGTANWNGGSIALQTGGGIVNAGTFDIKTDNSLVDNGADAGFTNSGLLRKSVTAGTTYYFQLDTVAGATGTLALDWSE